MSRCRREIRVFLVQLLDASGEYCQKPFENQERERERLNTVAFTNKTMGRTAERLELTLYVDMLTPQTT